MEIFDLKDKILKAWSLNAAKDKLLLEFLDGTVVQMFHRQDCCETVTLEDIAGNLDSLIGSPIIKAEKLQSSIDANTSTTYTFYVIATRLSHVVLRWCGTSNGYYSEEVDIEWV